MNHTKKRILPLLVVLPVLLLAGALLFAYGAKQTQDLRYPRKYEEYVEYYADKYGIDPLILYAFIRTESNLTQTLPPRWAPAA